MSVSNKASAAPASPNALPLDEAPRVPLKPGVEARYGLCPLCALSPNPDAVLIHPKRELDKLVRSIEITGHLAPVIVDERYMVLAGHGRIKAAGRLGYDSVPVVQVFGLTRAQKRAYLLADNRIGADARIDRVKFAEQIPELTLLLEEAGFELTDTGFEMGEIDELVIDFEEESKDPADTIDDALFEEPLLLRAGDLITMGDHQLVVDDARKPEVIARLMAGARASAAFLDVPYNVRVRDIGGRGRVHHPEFAAASGEMSRAEFVDFLKTVLGNAARVSREGAVHFVCIDWKHVRDLVEAGADTYGAYLNLVVWNKTNAGQGGTYRNQHELIGVFRVGDGPHRDNVQQGRFGRNRSNVWTYAGVNGFRAGRLDDLSAHPTVKPVQLVADALKDVTRRGDIVLDSFVGSGTTILAAEKVGRRARTVEIEPRYAQIAVRRWEAMTGRAAVHAESGVELDQLGGMREPPKSLPRARVRTRTLA